MAAGADTRPPGATGPGDDPVVESASLQETEVFGRLLGAAARAGDVLALSGPLGSGKTCLAQAVARGMGIVEPVQSPTFNLLLVHAGEPPLFHFDLYRLERAGQLEDIDFYETVECGGGVSLVEWADRFPGELPADRLDVDIEPTGETARRFTLQPSGRRATRLARTVLEAWRCASGREEVPR